MIVNKTYEIDSCDDAELGIKRNYPLEFRVCFDDDKDIKAIVFIVPGLGGDADSNYREHLAEYVASEFSVAVVSVNYHCIGNRPQLGSKFYLDRLDQVIFRKKCEEIGIRLEDDISLLFEPDIAHKFLNALGKVIADKKSNGKIAKNFMLDISASVLPTKDEYQNFGIMSAIDLLNALLFVQRSSEFRLWGGANGRVYLW
ncbi:DUF2920 family protein [Campylobacter anatolicus]|uniref:DUF2920 family protein n=1 Tax=Campylobacter anatolicus TaxID=2829105 RepID=UPI003B847D46